MLFREKELVLRITLLWRSLKAQINKIDMSTLHLLVETDANLIQELNTLSSFKYIFLAVFGKGFGDPISNLYSPRNSKTMKRIIFDFWGNENKSIQ